jgi:nucleotide-binding universal stress UspA family protein
VFRRILVGFDGSKNAHEALRTGIAMATAAEGEVAALIVVSASHGETEEDRRAAFDAETEPLRAAAERELGAVRRDEAASAVHVVAGDRPAGALSSYAEERGFDVLVVGRHGRERAAHGGLGRVARELAEKSRCPLLLVGDDDLDDD